MIGIPQASPPTKVHGLVIIHRLKVLPIILKQLHSLEPRETANSLDIRSLLLLEFQKHEQGHRLCSYMWSTGREVNISDIHKIYFTGHQIGLHLTYQKSTFPNLRLLPERLWCKDSRKTAADISRLCTEAAERANTLTFYPQL